MTQTVPVPTEAEQLAQVQRIQNLALTHRQIDAACRMWRDPDKWGLIPTKIGKRCLYVRKT
jgi:hypothetical protein